MENILTYIIIFGLLIIFTLVYFSSKEKSKKIPLTKKNYSFGSIHVLLEKRGSEFESLIVQLIFSKNSSVEIMDVFIELIDKNGEFSKLSLPNEIFLKTIDNEYFLNYSEIDTLLFEKRDLFQSFRLVALIDGNRKLKSGILSFNKNRKLVVPDSGNYN